MGISHFKPPTEGDIDVPAQQTLDLLGVLHNYFTGNSEELVFLLAEVSPADGDRNCQSRLVGGGVSAPTMEDRSKMDQTRSPGHFGGDCLRRLRLAIIIPLVAARDDHGRTVAGVVIRSRVEGLDLAVRAGMLPVVNHIVAVEGLRLLAGTNVNGLRGRELHRPCRHVMVFPTQYFEVSESSVCAAPSKWGSVTNAALVSDLPRIPEVRRVCLPTKSPVPPGVASKYGASSLQIWSMTSFEIMSATMTPPSLSRISTTSSTVALLGRVVNVCFMVPTFGLGLNGLQSSRDVGQLDGCAPRASAGIREDAHNSIQYCIAILGHMTKIRVKWITRQEKSAIYFFATLLC